MRLGLVVWLFALLAHRTMAEEAEFGPTRLEDTFGAPGVQASAVDPLKRIALFDEDLLISFGGELRHRYDYRVDEEWGEAPQDERGAFLQRYLLHANLEIGSSLRVFAQVRSAIEDGRTAPPSPVEQGRLDLQQGLLEFRSGTDGHEASTFVRLGRQELAFGSQRLIALREGPNIRRRFDGLQGRYANEHVQVSAIAAFLTENERGLFTDGTNEDVALWGLYVVSTRPLGLPSNLDVYYLGYRSEAARFVQGEARELRHSVGARFHDRRGPVDWNWEGVFQWGRFGSGSILAWTLATETGVRLDALPWAPRLALSANVASGDEDANDGTLGTFNPLFPRGNYFSHLALLGPRNFANLHPSITLELSPSLSLTVDTNFYWRLEKNDGLYGPAGNILRAGSDTNRRFVGTAISGSLDWTVNPFVFVGVIYTHGFAGVFLRETGPANDIDFVELTLQVRF